MNKKQQKVRQAIEKIDPKVKEAILLMGRILALNDMSDAVIDASKGKDAPKEVNPMGFADVMIEINKLQIKKLEEKLECVIL